MTEKQQGQANDNDGKLIYCRSCGSMVGRLINVNGQLWLDINDLEAKYIHGRCSYCKSIIHYDAETVGDCNKERMQNE